MNSYADPKQLLDRLSELRQSHAPMRAEVACRMALGMAYANGRHWTNVSNAPTGQLFVDTWDEDWDPHSNEIRVVDNRIGPLYRRVAASTNATRIEAAVSPPKHLRTIEASKRASVAQDVLNSMNGDAAFTLTARNASSLRWLAGSSLIYIQLSQKKRTIDANVAKYPDGSPIEINDQWVRWDFAPLSDLIWDPANSCADLSHHNVLALERVMSVRQFNQTYGAIEDYGLEERNLAPMGEMAGHYIAASRIAGTSVFEAYARMSREKAIRVITFMESDPRDPCYWPTCYTIVDSSPNGNGSVTGKVINFDNPQTVFGGHGRNIFKFDGFRRGDAMWSWGVPHILMGQQDMLNIAKSIQFQQMTAVVYGHWLLDTQTAKAEEFAESLAEGIGGILKYNSRSDPNTRPPEYVSPTAPNTEFVSIAADIGLSMRDAVHVTAASLGVGKTHIPEGIQQMLLQEGSVVVDNIIKADSDSYSECLETTLGTIRKVMDRPNRMLARLRDKHGFAVGDLVHFLQLDPHAIQLDVRVRENSIVSRSVDQRVAELSAAFKDQVISGMDFRATMADELERPLMRIDEKQIEFIKGALITVIHGQPWPGIPSLDFELFRRAVREAVFGMDMMNPDHVAAMARLEEALIVQHGIATELKGESSEDGAGQGQSQSMLAPDQPVGVNLLPQSGAPESINPSTSPVGASGGLPLGLPASVS